MYEGRIIRKGELTFTDVLNKLSRQGLKKTGAITSFIGVVRDTSKKGEAVKGLHIEAWREAADSTLNNIAKELSAKSGISAVLIYHVEGDLKVGDDIVYVAVAGDHRDNVFPVLREAVERYKRESEIWKKESLDSGDSYWVEEI